MPKGGKVIIELSPIENDGQKFARFEVIDQGVGTPKKHIPLVLEPIFTIKPSGTSLGLYAANEMVTFYEGDIIIFLRKGR